MRMKKSVCAVGLLFLFLMGMAGLAQAQGVVDRSLPSPAYYFSIDALRAGEYELAMEGFQEAARDGMRSSEGRWVDSICYHAMVGECYYRMGDLSHALERYDAALALYLVHHEWMLRVQFPQTVDPLSNPLSSVRWGDRTRRTRLGNFPDRMGVLMGRLNNEEVIREGGVVLPPEIRRIDVVEIIRCTSLALRRKREIMGPVAPHDPLVAQLLNALGQRPAPPNHWSQPWIDIQLGLVYSCAGDDAQAIAHLDRSLVIAGEYDHPLTSIALLELGKLAMKSEAHDRAALFFAEATFDAAAFGDAIVLEEAFRWGALNTLLAGGNTNYGSLATAADWARTRDLEHLRASLYLSAAEGMAYAGQARNALTQIDNAERTMIRRDMREGESGARLDYLTALVRFQQGSTDRGNNALAAAMNYQTAASPRLFQIALVDRLYIGGDITTREALELFNIVLAEPVPKDWVQNPRDTLAVSITPHLQPMEHWFEISLARDKVDDALYIADLMRRHRFHTSLPLGGRLLALRWILEAPDAALSDTAQLQRQSMMTEYPHYAQLAQMADGLEEQLRALPPDPQDGDRTRQRIQLLRQLAEVSANQEKVLAEISLRREPSEFAFPPLHKITEVQAVLPEETLVVAYFMTSQATYLFFLTHENIAYVELETTREIQEYLPQFLLQIGNYGANTTLNEEMYQDGQWKETGRALLAALMPTMQPGHWSNYDEIVIIPDGVLWHVPFEALQVGEAGGETQAINSLARVRYAPTLGLAIPDERGRPQRETTAVILGRLHPGDEDEIAEQALQQIEAVATGETVGYQLSLPATSNLLAPDWDRLIVFDDINDAQNMPYGWAPARFDAPMPGSQLQDWISLPWDGPEEILLPGFHTAAESALRNPTSGNEIFLSVCGFMASGARTVLLSRWRPGGQTAYDLIREYSQEAPHTSAADAWQRSVQTARNGRLDLEREPRLDLGNNLSEEPTADHPFFWAGYMLIDSGSRPAE